MVEVGSGGDVSMGDLHGGESSGEPEDDLGHGIRGLVLTRGSFDDVHPSRHPSTVAISPVFALTPHPLPANMKAMHGALTLPEIISRIIDCTDEADDANSCATVCKTWSGIALDRIWRFRMRDYGSESTPALLRKFWDVGVDESEGDGDGGDDKAGVGVCSSVSHRSPTTIQMTLQS